MKEKQLLLIPGPTPVPPSVLREHARPMINHRGPEFKALMDEITAGLKTIHKTSNDLLILTTSGTGAMEAAVVNVLSPGDHVLALVIGAFGERFAKIAEAYGANVERMNFEWGTAVDVAQLEARLLADTEKSIKAVLFEQNETSTGVVNPVEDMMRVIRAHGALSLCDAVSGLVAIDLKSDEWGIDLVASASQKAFMTPPGLAFVTMSARAWEAYKTAKMPRFYFDLEAARKLVEKGQTPWTPAVPQLFGLREGIRLIMEEGLDNCYARHERMGRMARSGCAALGLKLLAAPECASPAVTGVWAPEGLEAKAIRKLALEKYGVVFAGGQGKLAESIFRIGHLGFVNETDVLTAMAVIGAVLNEMGFACDTGVGIEAARAEL